MFFEAKNITKSYGRKLALDSLNLKLEPGKIISLLGPNGAGKSTAIRILTGQIKPDSGIIVIDEKEYNKVPDKFRGRIGVMPQDVIVWDDLTVLENLTFTAQLQKMHTSESVARVNELINSFKLEREIGTFAKHLSGGYRRRLSLAISIIHNPDIIFFDEPTPGVDPQHRRFIWDFIKDLRAEGKSIVLTDHYLDEAEELSDYVVVIDHGKVIAKGTVPELKKRFAPYSSVRIKLHESVDKEKIENLKPKFKEFFSNFYMIDFNVTFTTDKGFEEVQRVIKEFEKNGLKVKDLHVKDSTLEDVFIHLTGRNIREV